LQRHHKRFPGCLRLRDPVTVQAAWGSIVASTVGLTRNLRSDQWLGLPLPATPLLLLGGHHGPTQPEPWQWESGKEEAKEDNEGES